MQAVSSNAYDRNKVRAEKFLNQLYCNQSEPSILRVWKLLVSSGPEFEIERRTMIYPKRIGASGLNPCQATAVEFCKQAALASAALHKKALPPMAMVTLGLCWRATFPPAENLDAGSLPGWAHPAESTSQVEERKSKLWHPLQT